MEATASTKLSGRYPYKLLPSFPAQERIVKNKVNSESSSFFVYKCKTCFSRADSAWEVKMQLVYALVAGPVDEPLSVGYIGITDKPNTRHRQHLKLDGSNKKKDRWLQEQFNAGIPVRMVLLEVTENREQAKDRETYWIKFFAEQKAPLKNILKMPKGLFGDQQFEQLEQLFIGPMTYKAEAEEDMRCPLSRAFLLESRIYEALEVLDFPFRVVSWLKKNQYAYWYFGCLREGSEHLYDDALATVGLLPLEEEVMERLLRGEIGMYDIQPEHIFRYREGQTYSCFIPSAACQEGKHKYIGQLVLYALQYLRNNGIVIEALYTYASPFNGKAPLLHLVQDQFFTPLSHLSAAAWKLPLTSSYTLSSVAQEYQQYVPSSPNIEIIEVDAEEFFGMMLSSLNEKGYWGIGEPD